MSRQLFTRTSWDGNSAPPTVGAQLSLQLPFDLDEAGADDLVVKADVPKALRKVLKSDMPKITHMCVRENVEHVLRWFEQIIVERRC